MKTHLHWQSVLFKLAGDSYEKATEQFYKE